jgi:hypothetical protein
MALSGPKMLSRESLEWRPSLWAVDEVLEGGQLGDAIRGIDLALDKEAHILLLSLLLWSAPAVTGKTFNHNVVLGPQRPISLSNCVRARPASCSSRAPIKMISVRGGWVASAALSNSARTTWNTSLRLPLLPLACSASAHAMSIAAKAPLVLGSGQERLGSQAEGNEGRCPWCCRVLEEEVRATRTPPFLVSSPLWLCACC